VNEATALRNQFAESLNDSLPGSQACAFRSAWRHLSRQNDSIDKFALDLKANGLLVNGRFTGPVGATQNGA
jgi:hypothetical protein